MSIKSNINRQAHAALVGLAALSHRLHHSSAQSCPVACFFLTSPFKHCWREVHSKSFCLLVQSRDAKICCSGKIMGCAATERHDADSNWTCCAQHRRGLEVNSKFVFLIIFLIYIIELAHEMFRVNCDWISDWISKNVQRHPHAQ